MSTTKEALAAQEAEEAKGIAYGHVGEKRRDGRIFGTSRRAAYISVR
jgi:hypothetical protein